MFSKLRRRRENPTCMYALGSMYVGLAWFMSLAYFCGFFRLTSRARVKRITVGHLKVDRRVSVWLSFFHALSVWGRHVFLYVTSSGAHSEMYSCEGSAVSWVRALGFVPFVTRKVVKPRLLKHSTSSPSCGYSVGSPARLTATCFGCCASRYFCMLTFGFPLYPLTRRCCFLMHSVTMVSGSSHACGFVSFHRVCLRSPLWILQQKVQRWLQLMTVGVIWMHWWLFIP